MAGMTGACSKVAPKPEAAGSNSGSSGASGSAVTVVPDAAPPADAAPARLVATFYVSGAQGQCDAMGDSSCPPNFACNPPPPMKIECPPGIGKTRSDGVHVGRLPDQTCAIIDLGCEDVSCAHAATPCPAE